MGIPRYALERIAPYLKGARVLSLSYPDLVVHPKDIEVIFGFTPTKFTAHNNWHGCNHPLPETKEVMGRVCASFDCVDVVKHRGVERIVDLNETCDLGSYDLVLDPGTTEHCFNIGTAMMSAANAVAVGGRIMHLVPVSMINHGFWNVCPTTMHDFYTQNGWEIEALEIYARDKAGDKFIGNLRDNPTGRYSVWKEAGMMCLARRMSEARMKPPIQSKYVSMMKAAA